MLFEKATCVVLSILEGRTDGSYAKLFKEADYRIRKVVVVVVVVVGHPGAGWEIMK